ncbi:MAG: hypothetical protein LBQ89_08115 [Treponema sp.]|jgi:hypothetical protein|nr:hypothetical protein [Treponema sp.]
MGGNEADREKLDDFQELYRPPARIIIIENDQPEVTGKSMVVPFLILD